MQELIRSHLKMLIDKNHLPPATEEQIAKFKADWIATAKNPTVPCCTADTFRLDLFNTPKSPWNQCAAGVFYRSLVPPEKRTMEMAAACDKDFTSRIKTVINLHKKSLDVAAKLISDRKTRRYNRKYAVCRPLSTFEPHIDVR